MIRIPIRMEMVDSLRVLVFENRQELGSVAGQDVAKRISELHLQQEEVNIVLGSAPSQTELMVSLGEAKEVNWSRVNIFHMDEYIGMNENDDRSFSKYLLNQIVEKVQPKRFYIMDGTTDPYQECMRYSRLLADYPPDIVCLGIGENGHIAFNDPHVADFNDEYLVKIVELDFNCRRQQVNDGCFTRLEDVPARAITLTVPALMNGKYLYGIVPGISKAQAVSRTLRDSISPECPATILRTHPNCVLYVDRDSYGSVDSYE